MHVTPEQASTYGVDSEFEVRKYPGVPKRSKGSNPPRFPMFGTWLSGLRKGRRLEQQDLANKAGVSIDQVSRLERGENVGVWYVGAVLSALNEMKSLAGDEHGLIASLTHDGAGVRQSKVLQERLRDTTPPPAKKNGPFVVRGK